MQEIQLEKARSEQAFERVSRLIPLSRRRPLRMVVYNVLFDVNHPLNLAQIQERVTIEGYTSKAHDLDLIFAES